MSELHEGDLVVVTDIAVFEVKGEPECERVECGAPIVMMVQKNTGFCSRLCEEYEYWEEEFDDPETESP